MTTPARRALEVVVIETGEVVHSVDVTGKSDNSIGRVIAGMLINMDDRYYVRDTADED